MPEPISRREAALRTAAVAALCGLAIVQLLALPYALVQGPQIAAISGAAIAGALWLARALATAEADGGRAAWRGTIALSVLAGCGWVVTRAVAVPGVPEDAGHWTSPIGLADAVLAVVVLGLSVAALGRPRALRPLAAALAVGLALAPAAALLLVAFGPPPAHQHGLSANSISPCTGSENVSVTCRGGLASRASAAGAARTSVACADALATGKASTSAQVATSVSDRRRSAPPAPATSAAAAPSASARAHGGRCGRAAFA